MIDIHTHILHGLDDGPESLEESLEMCRMSLRDGVRIVVATPHTLNGVYQNDHSMILTRVRELNEALIQCGLRNSECGMKNSELRTPNSELASSVLSDSELRTPNSELVSTGSAFRIPNSAFSFTVLPGSDVSFSPDLLKRFETGEVGTLNDKGRAVLLEFPSQGIPYRAEEILFQLMARGITPIISHPERNFEIARNPDRYYGMIRKGCLGQVTAMSLTGEFGSSIRRVAENLLAGHLVHIIASDAHSVRGRPPILSEAVRAAERIVGPDEARKMVTEYPEAVLDGRRPHVPDPVPIDKWQKEKTFKERQRFFSKTW